jgi:hypothetical protein
MSILSKIGLKLKSIDNVSKKQSILQRTKINYIPPEVKEEEGDREGVSKVISNAIRTSTVDQNYDQIYRSE